MKWHTYLVLVAIVHIITNTVELCFYVTLDFFLSFFKDAKFFCFLNTLADLVQPS